MTCQCVALSTRRRCFKKKRKKRKVVAEFVVRLSFFLQRIFCFLANFMMELKIAAMPPTMPKVHR